VVDRSHVGGRSAAYHLTSASHGHLVCEQCGKTAEVPGEMLRDLTGKLTAEYGYAISIDQFSITGRCAGCLAPR